MATSSKVRLRFDRVALRLIKDLQAELSRAVPAGNVVVVTCTAPIRQCSKTTAALADRIRALLAAGRRKTALNLFGNAIQVRVLAGGSRRGPKLVGFVHNSASDAAILFDVTRVVLGSLRGD